MKLDTFKIIQTHISWRVPFVNFRKRDPENVSIFHIIILIFCFRAPCKEDGQPKECNLVMCFNGKLKYKWTLLNILRRWANRARTPNKALSGQSSWLYNTCTDLVWTQIVKVRRHVADTDLAMQNALLGDAMYGALVLIWYQMCNSDIGAQMYWNLALDSVAWCSSCISSMIRSKFCTWCLI